ncbi:scavenger receptor cysteine-rich domain superfamily protein-like [Oscarella lobularis]|uniref:scavenger receptor cysteine-rich domain superfamily protein-like n=1 Tax=Oscarella lobularis TaxID=121494 RepID=UPI003313B860
MKGKEDSGEYVARCRQLHVVSWLGLFISLVVGIATVYCIVSIVEMKQSLHQLKQSKEQLESEMNLLKSDHRDLMQLIRDEIPQSVPLPPDQIISNKKRFSRQTGDEFFSGFVGHILKEVAKRCQPGEFCAAGQKGEQGLRGLRGPKGEKGDRGKEGVSEDPEGSTGEQGQSGGPIGEYIHPGGSQMRLVGGSTEWEGRVELLRNGVWGTICDNDWDIADAAVACRQMNRGYSGATAATRGAHFGEGSGAIWMDGLRCSGTESDLSECSFGGWGIHQCNHSQDVGVVCTGDIRLVGGLRPEEGRLEVLRNGKWGTVCDKGWGLYDAHVACRQLGFHGAKQTGRASESGSKSDKIWMSNLACTGIENRLDECTFPGWGVREPACTHENDVEITCFADIRLVGGSSIEEGRVEVLLSGVWRAVCDDNWDMNDAQVVCRKLGYDKAKGYFGASFPDDQQIEQSTLENIQCTGDESDFADCSFRVREKRYCDRQAGVACVSDIRLVGGTRANEGIVEVLHKGVWGRLCSRNWDLNDAHVACRQLGYYRAVSYNTTELSGHNSEIVLMDKLACNGTEGNLADCEFSGWGKHDCTHRGRIATVVCAENIRLVDGLTSHSGNVEILHNGIWKAICENTWNAHNAHVGDVACQQLGFYKAKSSSIVETSQEVLSSGFLCYGNETKLDSCAQHNCHSDSSKRSVSVDCVPNLRLVGGSVPEEGRIEILHKGQWGTICDDNWEIEDATVACLELGYGPAKKYRSHSYYGRGTGPIWMDEVTCTVEENSLAECRFPGWGLHSCSHDEDAGIVCNKLRIRLIGGSNSNEGRVEIFHKGSWGGVCDSDWDSKAAAVVCRELGIFVKSPFATKGTFGTALQLLWMNDVTCSGDEATLRRCRFSSWTKGRCSSSSYVAGVICKESIRLVGGSGPHEGRVEVNYNNQWGRVCQRYWDLNDAHVVCRQLGFTRAQRYTTGSTFGSTSITMWMDEVRCNGNEKQLQDCSFDGWGNYNYYCTRYQYNAGVVCE